MNNAKILLYAEGAEDVIFLKDFVHVRFPAEKHLFDINATHSKTKIHKVAQQLQENEANDGINIIIFDADDDFQKASQDIIQERDRLGLMLDIFLFPDNAGKGQFETLLMQICPPENLPFFDCWKAFDACTRTLPTAKSTLYTKTESQCYCELFLDKNVVRKIEKKKIDYTSSDAWNLQHNTLNPLFNFLNQKIQEYYAKQL